jgi:hypothetical protein
MSLKREAQRGIRPALNLVGLMPYRDGADPTSAWELPALIHKPNLTFADYPLMPVDFALDPVLRFANHQG